MAETNVIEVILRSVDEMSKDLAQIQTEMGRFKTRADQVSVSTDRMTRSTGEFRRVIGPARSAISQLSSVIAQANPSMQIFVRTADDISLAMILAGMRTGSFAGALAFLTGPVGLITIAVIGLSNVIGSMIAKWNEAKKAAIEFANKTTEIQSGIKRVGVTSPFALAQLDYQTERERLRKNTKQMSQQQMDDAISLAQQKLALDLAKAKFDFSERQKDIDVKLLDLNADFIAMYAEQTNSIDDLRFAHERRTRAIEAAYKLETDRAKEARASEGELEAIRRTYANQKIELLERLRQKIIQVTQAWRAQFPKRPDEMELEDETNTTGITEAIFSGYAKGMHELEELAKDTAKEMAASLTDDFIAFLHGKEMSVQSALAAFGQSIMTQIMRKLIAQALIAPIMAQMSALGQEKFNEGGGFFGNLFGAGALLKGLGSFFGFAHGGMVVPHGAVRAFAGGGTVHGPTLGILGEEGSEIVARMKPARPGDGMGSGKIQVIIQGDIVPRDPSMRPRDVVLVLADDMERGGRSAKAVEMVMRRGR